MPTGIRSASDQTWSENFKQPLEGIGFLPRGSPGMRSLVGAAAGAALSRAVGICFFARALILGSSRTEPPRVNMQRKEILVSARRLSSLSCFQCHYDG